MESRWEKAIKIVKFKFVDKMNRKDIVFSDKYFDSDYNNCGNFIKKCVIQIILGMKEYSLKHVEKIKLPSFDNTEFSQFEDPCFIELSIDLFYDEKDEEEKGVVTIQSWKFIDENGKWIQ